MKTSRKIKLTLEQAREMYGKNESLDKLLLANFPELGVKKVGKWEDLGEINGFAISDAGGIFRDTGGIYSFASPVNTEYNNRNIFATESQAKSALAMAQLSQLMKHVNGDWVADWTDANKFKYVIKRFGQTILTATNERTYMFLAFPTSAIRDQFLSDHEQLIKTYFEL